MAHEGTYSCACKKVSIQIHQPFTSYGLVAPTSALCQCGDCNAFASAARAYRDNALKNDEATNTRAEVSIGKTHATHLLGLYMSDLRDIQGSEYLRGVKLTQKSPFLRFYATCCGTAMGGLFDGAPFCLLYRQHFDPNGTLVLPAPTIVLNHASAPPESEATPKNIPTVAGFVPDAGLFLVRMLCRIILAFIFGKFTSPVSTELLDALEPPLIGAEAMCKKTE